MITHSTTSLPAVFTTSHTASVFGQGTIRGVITDSLEHQPLAGANVSLVGTAFGAATD